MNTGKWFGTDTPKMGIWFIVLVLFLMAVLPSGVAIATFGDVALVSSDNEGVVGNNASQASDVSTDSRYVVFSSLASNLVPGDDNDTFDVFLKDTQTLQIWLVSHSLGGAGPANGPSFKPSVSADGRYVLFASYASDIVANDTNNWPDMFVWDKVTQETIRVSVAWDGSEGNGSAEGGDLSGDGQWVVFTSDSTNLVPGDNNGFTDIFLRDLGTWELFRITPSLGVEPDGNSYEPVISVDGAKVAFSSTAGNWVSGAWSGFEDVYLHNVGIGQTSYVVRNTTGGPGDDASSDPRISPNGRYVAFQSFAENLSPIDTNGFSDVYLLDTQTGNLTLVSVDLSGTSPNNNSGLFGLDVTDNGWVAFESKASDIVPATSGFLSRVYLRSFGQTQLLVGGDPSEHTQYPVIASNQAYVVFESQIPDLVLGDDNGTWDVFLLDITSPTPTPTPTPTVTPTAPIGSTIYMPIVLHE